jgi:hypothetical protein
VACIQAPDARVSTLCLVHPALAGGCDMRTQPNRRSFLFRRAHGKTIFDVYLSKIASVVVSDMADISLLGLEETDCMMEKYREKLRALDTVISVTKFTNEGTEICLDKTMDFFPDFTKGKAFVLIDHDWEYCGAFIIESIDSIQNKILFGDKISDVIGIMSDDLTETIYFDCYEMNGKYYIEIERTKLSNKLANKETGRIH